MLAYMLMIICLVGMTWGIIYLFGRKEKPPRNLEYQNNGIQTDLQEDDKVEKTEPVRQKMIKDTLTGLYSHQQFYERLKSDIEHVKKEKTKLFLLMIDIDQFKNFNEQFGTKAGDQVLEQIGEVIRYNICPTDFAARYGGEEFTVILMNTTHENAAMIADRIRYDIKQAIKEIEELKDKDASVTVSIGIACYPDSTNHLRSLVDIADVKMYEGKEMGGDQVIA
ncbi:GGDEF domain-containing protein [Clostridiaceae bacterium 35-E11]